jgi:hypothetical protein
METRPTSAGGARIVGILFLIATLFFVVGQSVSSPILEAPGYLEAAYPGRSTLMAATLLEVMAVLAIPLIPVFLLPVLRPGHETLGRAYLVCRLLEAAFLLVAMTATLTLVDISEAYLAAIAAGESNGVTAAGIEVVGSAVRSFGEWAFVVSVGLLFPAGALVLYAVLYRTRLVPRWLSVWGFAGAVLLLCGSVTLLFGAFAGLAEGLVETVLAGPIAINELVLAGWLIVKGFDT